MHQLSPFLMNPKDQLLMFWCPGCDDNHMVNVAAGGWKWNGDPNKPTFEPSRKVTGVERMTDEQHKAYTEHGTLPVPVPTCCHSFVTKGVIQFLSDCTHSMAGQNVPMPEWPANRIEVNDPEGTPNE